MIKIQIDDYLMIVMMIDNNKLQTNLERKLSKVIK